MTAISGIWHNGQVILDQPADWPEGCRLRIEPVPAEQLRGPADNDEPETPEEIEEWLRWYRSLEPLEFTPEEASFAGRKGGRGAGQKEMTPEFPAQENAGPPREPEEASQPMTHQTPAMSGT